MPNRDENTYLVDSNWYGKLESMIGKFEVAPSPQAQIWWNVVKKNPDKFVIAFSYTEIEATGEKELVGMSLIMNNQKNPQERNVCPKRQK